MSLESGSRGFEKGDEVRLKRGILVRVVGPCTGYTAGEMGPHWVATVLGDPNPPPFRHKPGSRLVFTPEDVENGS